MLSIIPCISQFPPNHSPSGRYFEVFKDPYTNLGAFLVS